MGSSSATWWWGKEEDEALSQAWVAASEDTITGTGQKASKFCSRVFKIYVELIPDGRDCTSTACTAIWGTINQDMHDKGLWPLFTGYVFY